MDSDQMTFNRGSLRSCREVEELVDLYIDDEMAESLRADFERHLECCEACKCLVGYAQEVLEASRSLAEKPVPAAVSRRLRLRLADEIGTNFSDTKPRLYIVK